MAKVAFARRPETPETSASLTLTAAERREIEKLAYQFFLERGCQHGFDAQDWYRAETTVLKRRR